MSTKANSEEIEGRTVPFHSEAHKEVSLWLQANRHLTIDERLSEITFLLMKAGVDLNPSLSFHYATCFFLAMDMYLNEVQEFPAQLHDQTLRIKKLTDFMNSERMSQTGKNAKAGKDKKFQTIKDDLKAYWKDSIKFDKKATDAAILLEKAEIFNKSDTKPKRSTLETYVREWQLENKLHDYWENNIDPAAEATDAAILLEKAEIYINASSKIKPERSTLETYVREWQKVRD
jgi:hypothetical protein